MSNSDIGNFIIMIMWIMIIFILSKKHKKVLKENIALKKFLSENHCIQVNDFKFPEKFTFYSSHAGNQIPEKINEHINAGIIILKSKIDIGERPIHAIYNDYFCLFMAAIKNKDNDMYSVQIIFSDYFHQLKMDNVLFI